MSAVDFMITVFGLYSVVRCRQGDLPQKNLNIIFPEKIIHPI